MKNYNRLISYIKTFELLPTRITNSSIYMWRMEQRKEYSDPNSFLNQSKERRELWEIFITTYSHLKPIIEIAWINKLNDNKKYIDTYGKLPPQNEILGKFIYFNHKRYQNKISNTPILPKQRGIKLHMEEKYILLWEEFIHDEKYKQYF